MPDIATQTPIPSGFVETSCPLKYEEEVILRPENYHAKCACCSENSNIETNNYEITFDYRPKLKDISKGFEREKHECLIDLCDNHYNKILNENNGKLPVLIGNDLWDAVDCLNDYTD